MKKLVIACIAANIVSAVPASAEGQLNIFTWGNIIPLDMLKKFEERHQVKVSLTDYDSSDAALAKVRQGGHGFDAVVVISSYVPIWIQEGFLLETRPDQMPNFSNVDQRWIDVPFDPGRRYTVPYEIGTTGVSVDTSVYKGDINSSAIFLDPPAELQGKINVVPAMDEVMHLAITYAGGEACTTDKEVLKKVRDTLLAAKPAWKAMDYNLSDRVGDGDIAAGVSWSGASVRARAKNPNVRYGFPKEGFPIWMDNVAVLKDAKNVENARLFQDFVMEPENAAMIADFTRYLVGIKGVEKFLSDEVVNASENVISETAAKSAQWLNTCPPEATELYSKIWASIQK